MDIVCRSSRMLEFEVWVLRGNKLRVVNIVLLLGSLRDNILPKELVQS